MKTRFPWPRASAPVKIRFSLHMTPELLLRPTPPPLWFVSNGDKTVGPVSTNLLLRGIAADRVPNDCMVRERSWHDWRALDSVREVAALRRDQSRYGQVHVPRARYHYHGPRTDVGLALLKKRLHWARNPTEALSIGLTEALKETGALVGAVHKRHSETRGLATVVVMGPGMHWRVGRVVRAGDPVLDLAEAGQSLFKEPDDVPSKIVQGRLGEFPACSGVAMMPIRCAARLFAMIELGRPDHAFRKGDMRRLAHIAGAVAERFETVMNVS
jgi:hypothetical protein